MTRILHDESANGPFQGAFDASSAGRIGIGVLADTAAVQSLADTWQRDDLPSSLLWFFAELGLDLGVSGSDLREPLLMLVGHHDDSLASWSLQRHHGDYDDARNKHQMIDAEYLLKGIVNAGKRCDWPECQRALASGRALGVVRLVRSEANTVALLRPLLSHAEQSVRVCDLA